MINLMAFKERFGEFDKEVIVEIIDIFIQEYDERILSITQFIDNQNLNEFRKAVHGFKGVMSNFDEESLAYHKIVFMHHHASVLFEETQKGHVLSKEELGQFFTNMTKEFEVFKPASYEMLNDLKAVRNEYL